MIFPPGYLWQYFSSPWDQCTGMRRLRSWAARSVVCHRRSVSAESTCGNRGWLLCSLQHLGAASQMAVSSSGLCSLKRAELGSEVAGEGKRGRAKAIRDLGNMTWERRLKELSLLSLEKSWGSYRSPKMYMVVLFYILKCQSSLLRFTNTEQEVAG